MWKKIHNTICTLKKNQKEAFWYFREIQHFFFSLLCSAKAKKMNVTIGSQAQQYYVKC